MTVGSAPLTPPSTTRSTPGPLPTAVPRFRFPEEHEPDQQGYQVPADPPQPQPAHRHRSVTVGTVFEVSLLPSGVEGATRRVVRVAARPRESLRVQDRVPDPADEHRVRVDLQEERTHRV